MEQPKILEIPAKKMAGMHTETPIQIDKTRILWSQFMPRLKQIRNQKRMSGYRYV